MIIHRTKQFHGYRVQIKVWKLFFDLLIQYWGN